MSNSLEDFFNKLAGKDILKEMRDEEQAKIDAEAKLVAEQQEKAKVEKEKINPKPRKINLIYRIIFGFFSDEISLS